MTTWREFDGWVYEYFDRDIEPEAFPGFEDLVSLWHDKRGERAAPAWSDFDFYDFKGWHGWIALYDVTWDPFNYVCRLSGTQIDELYGFNSTGFDSVKMNKAYAESTIRDEFDEMNCRNLTLSRITGPLNIAGKTFTQVIYFELPFSEDGERASGTLEAVVPLEAESD